MALLQLRVRVVALAVCTKATLTMLNNCFNASLCCWLVLRKQIIVITDSTIIVIPLIMKIMILWL